MKLVPAAGFAAALVLFGLALRHIALDADHASAVTVSFDNQTEARGLLVYLPTFSAVVSDLDNDGLDDLLVGHHDFPPALYLNRGETFIEAGIEVLPIADKQDRHGYVVVDVDNDGDRDLLLAGGGTDGIGTGTPNQAFQNQLAESGRLVFTDVSEQAGIAFPTLRARQFLPLPSPNGDMVDFYLTSLHGRRENTTNLYFSNKSDTTGFHLSVNEDSSLNHRVESDGKDLFFDFDRDGDVDFLKVGHEAPRLLVNNNGIYSSAANTELQRTRFVISAVATDLNNDGYLDLYLGANSGFSNGDNFSADANEIHYSVAGHGAADSEGFVFRTSSRAIGIDLFQHNPQTGKTLTSGEQLYFGASKQSPRSRRTRVKRGMALGEPASFDAPGTYLWYTREDDTWHVYLKHGEGDRSSYKGLIRAQDIEIVARTGMEPGQMREVRDYILINQQGRGWRDLRLDALEHDQWTNYLTAADFNNDGHIDIAGVRTRDEAQPNGEPFILLNEGGLKFRMEHPLNSTQDDLFRGDIIVHGFFNDDGLPDLFYTNGYGLRPSRLGPYQLWLNTTEGAGGYVIVDLVGTRANRDAIGAQVELYNGEGDLVGYRELGPGYGRGQDTHKLHFGLGEHPGPFEARIRWPGSDSEQRVPVTANTVTRIKQS